MMNWLLRFVLLFSLFIYELPLNAQIIFADRRVDWSVAGLRREKPTYTEFRNIANFGGNGNGTTTNDGFLQLAIASLGNDSGIIYFPPGNYLFTSPIKLRSGLVLRGADASLSTITFNLASPSHAIHITGNSTNDTTHLSESAFKGANEITVLNAAAFQVNDYVKIYQNDTSLVNNDYAINSVAQILRIVEINGNLIKLNSALRRNFALAFEPRLRKLNMTSGVGLECLKIKRLDSTQFKSSNVYIEFAAQCWITGIESDTANFAHIQFGSSSNIEVKGSYLHGSFGFGPNGQGYGISGEYSSGECLIENNVFSRLRHAMIFQTGANGNVIGYNFSRNALRTEAPTNLSGDIVLHGNYPYANLFEGNICENIVIDASHRINGPFNTFFRNRATMYGILMSSNAGDSTNFVGNEITATTFPMGLFSTTGLGNFSFANNQRGNIIPAGTSPLPDQSYYLSMAPAFWEGVATWPSIGLPNTIGSGTIPAKLRFEGGLNYTICSPRYTYTFNGNGSWLNNANWVNQLVAPTTITSGVEVVINPIAGGECTYTGTINVQKGGIITVKQGKILNINSN